MTQTLELHMDTCTIKSDVATIGNSEVISNINDKKWGLPVQRTDFAKCKTTFAHTVNKRAEAIAQYNSSKRIFNLFGGTLSHPHTLDVRFI